MAADYAEALFCQDQTNESTEVLDLGWLLGFTLLWKRFLFNSVPMSRYSKTNLPLAVFIYLTFILYCAALSHPHFGLCPVNLGAVFMLHLGSKFLHYFQASIS